VKTYNIKIFGILNITPDSFSDGGDFLGYKKSQEHAKKLLKKGADFIDVGGESTNPWATDISCDTEWNRVKKILDYLLDINKKIISLDTKNYSTAKKFLEKGGQILNDVSGFQDPKMINLAVKFQPQVIVNHFPGKTTAEVHTKKINNLEQVKNSLLKTKIKLIQAGLSHEKIILDPGIGFGKTNELNWKLLEFAKFLPEEKIMIGFSKKRFLGEKRFILEPNLEAAKIAIKSGAKFLRLHEDMILKNFLTNKDTINRVSTNK